MIWWPSYSTSGENTRNRLPCPGPSLKQQQHEWSLGSYELLYPDVAWNDLIHSEIAVESHCWWYSWLSWSLSNDSYYVTQTLNEITQNHSRFRSNKRYICISIPTSRSPQSFRDTEAIDMRADRMLNVQETCNTSDDWVAPPDREDPSRIGNAFTLGIHFFQILCHTETRSRP